MEDKGNRLGTMILVNAWEDKIYAVTTQNMNDFRKSVEVFIEKADGRVSEPYTVRKRDIITKKSSLDFLYDCEIELTRDDIDAIKNKIFNLLNQNKESVQVQTRATVEEVHVSLSEFARDEKEELADNPYAEVFLKGGYVYMRPQALAKFLKENKELGYKKLELLKIFKIRGILLAAKNRPYDCLVSINGEKKWFYRFILHEEVATEEEEVEMITV